MNNIRFSANYEITLPEFREEMASRFKQLPEAEGGKTIEVDFTKDPEFADDMMPEFEKYKVQLYLDDFDDLNIATNHPLSKTQLERTLFNKALLFLKRRVGLPQSFIDHLMDRTFTVLVPDRKGESALRVDARDFYEKKEISVSLDTVNAV